MKNTKELPTAAPWYFPASTFFSASHLNQLHHGIIERHAAANLVDHTGVFQVGIDPHRRIGMYTGCPAGVSVNDFAIDGHILGS